MTSTPAARQFLGSSERVRGDVDQPVLESGADVDAPVTVFIRLICSCVGVTAPPAALQAAWWPTMSVLS
ncbi:hypothetical protein ACLQ22_17435 [Micromonospora sp. DT178]|uniref:hypothetical protein n=1 Tax=Micromonospora sp. DT178 TaxID=3393436 RepID=UPI003CEFAFD7